MIWTERFSAWGDFELHIFSTPEMRRLLPAGTRLAMSDSYRVMTTELIENTVDADGRTMLKVSGRSIEALMDERLARNTFANLTTTPKWTLTGTPANIARQIFNEIMRTNVNFADDELPFLAPGVFFPPGTIGEPTDVITIQLDLTSVYKAIQDICTAYDLGFRIIRNFDNSELYFDVYSGNDRTTLQSTLAPVVFAPNLDNLTNISEVTSTANYRNVAYVFHPNGVQTVTADGVSVTVEGFERRVLYVDASDIQLPAGSALNAALIQRGTDELNKNRAVQAFDGELPSNSPYKYEIAYQLGDKVEMRNDDGVTNQMRVTEQIFVSDAQGERSYPTLAIDRFITPGSWFAWDYNQTWSTADGYWGDL
jgi:hypothetical protein